jgi:isoleucyl-tRNA synthetase
MLQRSAQLIEEVSADFERFQFYRFFQALQNFCVVDLSNVYLDIAKDRLYVSSAGSFRRRSCQTVLHLIVERLAGLIAPVLCHMAEDIWQNLPYGVSEPSVFERGWPTAPKTWAAPDLLAPMRTILELRARVNQVMEGCRNQGQLGASLEAQVQISFEERVSRPSGAETDTAPQACEASSALGGALSDSGVAKDSDRETEAPWETGEGSRGEGFTSETGSDRDMGAEALRQALALLKESPHPEVDNLADWLLVSALPIGGKPLPRPLAEASHNGVTIRVARADGRKCERCWHVESRIGEHASHPDLCGRCVAVVEDQNR